MPQMIFHERRDEVVAVIVARMHAQRQRLRRFAAGRVEPPVLQLRFEEFVGVTLIDEDRAREPRCRP